jgi:hypothetical protein
LIIWSLLDLLSVTNNERWILKWFFQHILPLFKNEFDINSFDDSNLLNSFEINHKWVVTYPFLFNSFFFLLFFFLKRKIILFERGEFVSDWHLMLILLSKCSLLTALFEEACFFWINTSRSKRISRINKFFFLWNSSQIEIQFQNQIQSVGNYIPLITKKKKEIINNMIFIFISPFSFINALKPSIHSINTSNQ